MKNVFVCLVFLVACGSKKPEPAPASPPAPAPATQPDPNAGSGVGDACKAAGGTCMNVTATVVCKSKPEAPCQENHFCCIP